jgi:hypothetical protein
MSQPPLKIAGAFRAIAYLLLGYAATMGILDMVLSATPLLPELVAWRLKVEGLAAAGWVNPALMILLMGILALASEDRKVLQVLGVSSAIIGVLLLATSGLFSLDALQMNRSVPAADKRTYMISAVYAMARLGMGILSFALLSWSSLRASRSLRKSSAASSRQGVMVGAVGAPSA